MPPKLQLRLLGEVSIQKGNQIIKDLPSRAAKALFIYLACNRHPISREKLAELLWADRDLTQALTNLRTILSSLRRELGDYLLITRDTLAINAEADIWLDIEDFENQLRQLGLPDHGKIPQDPLVAANLQSALSLYHGDFLDGFYLRDGRGFEEWAILQREQLSRLAREGFRYLTHHCLEEGSYTQGLLSASLWQRLEPYGEEACRMQMWLHIRTGQRNAALKCYQDLKKKLIDDLKVVPAALTTDLFRKFQQTDFPPALHLPAFSTRFVGRGKELEKLEGLLTASQTRLITMSGTGGMGKTRLAVEAARFLAERKPGQFLNGIHFVSLATVDTAVEIPARIAEIMGFVFQGADSFQKELLHFLREREALLILDNFEHLLEQPSSGISLVVDILQQASAVKLLVTSRERLNLYDELLFDVYGLDVQKEHGAVELFCEGVQRIHRDYFPSDEEKEHIAHICQLVEGMPLAIELASAWIREYTCIQIAAQIEKDLDFLTSSYADVAADHRSLRAVFERSWKLLSAEEQNLFAQLSVFRDGFTLEAAEAVIVNRSEDHIREVGSVQRWIVDLADKSLLQRQPDGRYDIHPILRQYTSEKLSSSSVDQEAVLTQHAVFYLNFLTHLGDGESAEQRAAIRPERANIRLSWERAARYGMWQELEKTAGVLQGFFSMQSWFQEGIDLFQKILGIIDERAAHPGEPDGLICELLGRKARMHIQIGQLENARSDLKKALLHLEHMEDPLRRSRVLDSLAITHYYAGDYPQAALFAEESLRISETGGNQSGITFSLNFLGSCAKAQGEYIQCRTYFEHAVAAYHRVKDEVGVAMVLNNLGNLLQAQNDFDGAQEYYSQSAEILKAHDHVHGVATILANAGKLAIKQEKYELAKNLLTESLAMKRKINDQRGEAVAMYGLADTFLAMNMLVDSNEQLNMALKMAGQVRDVQLILNILVVFAALWIKQERMEEAHRLLSFVISQPGIAEESRLRATNQLGAIRNIPSLTLDSWSDELLDDVVSLILNET